MSVNSIDLPHEDEIDGSELEALNQARRRYLLPQWSVVVLAILFVFSPLLYEMGQRMWSRPHYQFFPFIIVGFVFLAKQRFAAIQWPLEQVFSIRHFLYLSAAAVLFLVAVETNSEWLGLVSCLGTLWTSVWFFGGPSAADQLRGPFAFLGLLIPLPMNLDEPLILELQKTASQIASSALESRSVWHTLSGVVIRASGKNYLVEEACSGIQSLFSAIATMSFLCVYGYYGILRSILTLASSVFCVIAANGFRVFLVVYSYDRFGVALDSGWQHEALGIGVFATAILLALSIDQLLRFIIPITPGQISDFENEYHLRVKAPFISMMRGLFDQRAIRGTAAVWVPAILFSLSYYVVGGLITAKAFFKESPSHSASALKLAGEIHLGMKSETLPEWINGFEKTDFKKITRKADDALAANSISWTFNGQGMNAIVSLDGYYPGWHDLEICYSGLGWKLDEEPNDGQALAEIDSRRQPVPWRHLSLYRDEGVYASVYFSAFDAKLAPISPPKRLTLSSYLSERFADQLQMKTATQGIVPPVFQIQLYVETPVELLTHESRALEELFVEVRSRIVRNLAAEQ